MAQQVILRQKLLGTEPSASDTKKTVASEIPNPNKTVGPQYFYQGFSTVPGSTGNEFPVILVNPSNGRVDVGGKYVSQGTGGMDGELVLRNEVDQATYHVEGKTGTSYQIGAIVLAHKDSPANARPETRILLDPVDTSILLLSESGESVLQFAVNAGNGTVTFFSNGTPTILLEGDSGRQTVAIAHIQQELAVAGTTADDADLYVADGTTTVKHLNVKEGLESLKLRARHIDILNASGTPTIQLDGESGSAHAMSLNVDKALAVAGATASDADLHVADGKTTIKNLSVKVNLDTAKISAQRATLLNDVGTPTIELDGKTGKATLSSAHIRSDLAVGGTTSEDADLYVGDGKATVDEMVVNKKLTAPTVNAEFIDLCDEGGAPTIQLLGKEGDIRLLGADCAEDFDVAAEVGNVLPGMVVAFDDSGKLVPSSQPYDRRVAGVISGAGDFQPGIRLDQRGGVEAHRCPVALVGKVYCEVDADYGAIEVGDLLTSSPTCGSAMKAADAQRAFGATIGKALRAVKQGQALIPIMVALQ